MLNEIDTLDFEVLIPGHGPVQCDRTYFSRLTSLVQTHGTLEIAPLLALPPSVE